MSCLHISKSYTIAAATGAATASTHAPLFGIRNLRLAANTNFWFNVNVAADKVTGIFVPTNEPLFLHVNQGDIISVLADATAGLVSVVESGS